MANSDLPPGKLLFSLQIPNTTSGTITCTLPSSLIYLLTFSSPPDNRLTTSFCRTLLLALDILEHSYPSGVVVTTSAIRKFYSNGLDLRHAFATKDFMATSLYPLFRRFLTYPMPTIALINGHAFAAGFMLAMHHDYRMMPQNRGFLCLNEVEFGVPLQPPMSSVFRQKCDPTTYRDMVLEAKRFGGEDALRLGLVDGVGEGWGCVEELVSQRGLREKGKSGVYGELKEEMWRESVALLEGDGESEIRKVERGLARERLKSEGKIKVTKWAKEKL